MFPTPPDASALDPEALAGLLRWYADMGVDIAVEGAPRDRFADALADSVKPTAPQALASLPARAEASAAPPTPRAMPGVPPPAIGAALAVSTATRSARELAASAHTLDELRATLAAFDGCALKRTASQLVFADGTPGARVMLVGEAPGGDEDKIGRPFVGAAGQLLDRMLAAIALDRADVYIANVVPWRPPGNRTPTPQETAVCLPFILRQIELANPEFLVCLGAASMQTLLGVKEGITRARGSWHEFVVGDGAKTIPALATLHPAYLLRSPGAKRGAWADLRALRKALDGLEKPVARPVNS